MGCPWKPPPPAHLCQIIIIFFFTNLAIQVTKMRQSEESACHKSFPVLDSYIHTPFAGPNIFIGPCNYPRCDTVCPPPPPRLGKSQLHPCDIRSLLIILITPTRDLRCENFVNDATASLRRRRNLTVSSAAQSMRQPVI